ncbi:MAG: AbrB/MazE/SpoVT family DNA-binding domain-containing protein [Nitrospinae bacterium]|nr:AbrB/MazE/SpoVT family DNA-binding domain-containing protein [Nitrospinota bacterium]
MAHKRNALELTIGPQGRVVIPAPMRKAMGIGAGDALVAHLEEDRLVLEKADAVKRRLKGRFSAVDAGVSLAGELIADRREESARENAG